LCHLLQLPVDRLLAVDYDTTFDIHGRSTAACCSKRDLGCYGGGLPGGNLNWKA
jgi:hypothetical protein